MSQPNAISQAILTKSRRYDPWHTRVARAVESHRNQRVPLDSSSDPIVIRSRPLGT